MDLNLTYKRTIVSYSYAVTICLFAFNIRRLHFFRNLLVAQNTVMDRACKMEGLKCI